MGCDQPTAVVERWAPDPHLAASVLAAPRVSWSLVDLCPADRAWTVVELTRAGLGAREIAERLNCGRRLVNQVRADPLYVVASLLLERQAEHAAELAAAHRVLASVRGELGRERRLSARLRGQVDQLLDARREAGQVPGFVRCGHPRVRYNTYRHGGYERCRQCRADWQANRRRVLREQEAQAGV